MERKRFFSDYASAFAMKPEDFMAWLDQFPNGKILDLGCGHGNALFELNESGYNVIGIDIDPSEAKIADNATRDGLNYWNKGKVINSDFDHIPLADNSIDAILCSFSALYYVESAAESIPKQISEILRVLKPDGKLLLTLDLIKGPRLPSAFMGISLPSGLEPENKMDNSRLRDLDGDYIGIFPLISMIENYVQGENIMMSLKEQKRRRLITSQVNEFGEYDEDYHYAVEFQKTEI